MLKIDPKWGETPESLFRQAIESSHKRFRERYLALALIALGEPAIKVAHKLGRSRGTVEEWVHEFNTRGLDGLVPKWKGNPGTILSEEELEQLRTIVQKPPRDSGFKNGAWTGRLIAAYIKRHFGKKVSPRTALRYLHRLGFRQKRPRKKLKKADPEKQREFAKDLKELEERRSPRSVTAYTDEGQIWCDALLRRVWCLIGQPAEVESTSPSKKEKLLFYVVVVRPLGKVITMITDWFNQENTAVFLDKVRNKLKGWRIDLVWDRATSHRGHNVREALKRTRIHEHKLPPYSPEMDAAEYWIGWAKEQLSANYCWPDRTALVRSFNGFVVSMSKRSKEVLKRCTPDMHGYICL